MARSHQLGKTLLVCQSVLIEAGSRPCVSLTASVLQHFGSVVCHQCSLFMIVHVSHVVLARAVLHQCFVHCCLFVVVFESLNRRVETTPLPPSLSPPPNKQRNVLGGCIFFGMASVLLALCSSCAMLPPAPSAELPASNRSSATSSMRSVQQPLTCDR